MKAMRSGLLTVSAVIILTLIHGQCARADDSDRSNFRRDCEAGGGLYFEAADGSFRCDLRGGGTVACTAAAKCTHAVI